MKLRSLAGVLAIGVIATLVLAVAVVLTLLRTSDATAVSDNAALIGAVVALGGVFTAQMVSIALDNRRSEESRKLEAERAREAALQNYFEQVGTLLIEQPLRRASPGDNLSTEVRAQTLAVLEGLDPYRKRILLQFLYESGLIHKNKPVVSLVAANLSKADLSEANLSGAFLGSANLSGANLSGTDLSGTDLSKADLRGANLSKAFLSGANMSGSFLIRADLSEADLSEANLSGASPIGANMSGVNLSEADMSKADLSWANLSGAFLGSANLSGAGGITNEKLEQQAIFLKDAIMPDESQHP